MFDPNDYPDSEPQHDAEPPTEWVAAQVPPDDVDIHGCDGCDGCDCCDCCENDGGPDVVEAASPREAWTAAAAARAAQDQLLARLASERAGLDPDQTLARLSRHLLAQRRHEAGQLELAAHWADLHSCWPDLPPGHTRRRRPGDAGLVRFGGDGTPLVWEFATAELAVALQISTTAAGSLLADALDLRHRLPRLWTRVRRGEVAVYLARQAARRTRRLSVDAAQTVDAAIVDLAAGLTFGRFLTRLDAEVVRADPDAAAAEAAARRKDRGVWIDHDRLGYGTLFAKATSGDLAALEGALHTIATALATLGDTDTLDVRRAKALGYLACPDKALQLIADAHALATPPDQPDQPDQPSQSQRLRFGTAIVYLHLTLADLLTGHGVARWEQVGPVLLSQLDDLLARHDIVVKPVLDPAGLPACDRYEVPARLREAMHLTKPSDCFPYASNTGRRMDADHTDPYVPMDHGGPPGQTRLDNLGFLTRAHHRVKTHAAGWRVSQPRDGTYVWRSPHGHYFLVDQYGTLPLGILA